MSIIPIDHSYFFHIFLNCLSIPIPSETSDKIAMFINPIIIVLIFSVLAVKLESSLLLDCYGTCCNISTRQQNGWSNLTKFLTFTDLMMLDPPHVHYYKVQHILVLFAEGDTVSCYQLLKSLYFNTCFLLLRFMCIKETFHIETLNLLWPCFDQEEGMTFWFLHMLH